MEAVGLLIVLVLAVIVLLEWFRAGSLKFAFWGEQRQIHVIGRGVVQVIPDEAQMRVGIRATATTAQEARATAAEAMQRVITALRDEEIGERDMQTGQFSITPEYRYDPDGQHQIGHSVTNSLLVRCKALDRVSAIVDATIAAGGNTIAIEGIQFLRGDAKPAQEEARQKAVADARAQAESLAREAGVHVGVPLAIGVAQHAIPPRPMMKMRTMAVAAEASTPIEAGELEVAVEIDVTFAIKR